VLIPSVSALTAAMSRASELSVFRLDDIGAHYAPTLRAWRERFVGELPAVRSLGFDDTFVRTWTLYLSFSEAAFAERDLSDVQIVFTKPLNRRLT
jgi:cyclopropane-fatty-acyl-phospholipid synthase